VNDLGGNMPTFALNFSRPGAEVVAQYYNFSSAWAATGSPRCSSCPGTWPYWRIGDLAEFRVVTRGDQLSVFAVHHRCRAGWDVFAVGRRLKERGWQLPAYTRR
jgi:glutamate decarboxylase